MKQSLLYKGVVNVKLEEIEIDGRMAYRYGNKIIMWPTLKDWL